MTTISAFEELTGTNVLDYLDRSVEVPVVTTIAAQGDVLICRTDSAPAVKPMDKAVTVVRSEASSNTHTLHPDGPCFWEFNDSASVTDLVLGKLTVPEGSKAVLAHQEHAFLSIEPGNYTIGRQREFAGEWQMVAD